MGHYVGARYVPKFANPLEWAENTAYEAMTVVSYNNNSYTSKIPVPATVGNPADNPDYWALTGNYNAQVEQYRQETENYNAQVEQYRQDVVKVKKDVNNNSNNITNLSNKVADFLAIMETCPPAISHRMLYRGKNLGTSFTTEQSQAVQNGTFTDMYVGDYWVINGKTRRIGDIDYFIHCGDNVDLGHHLLMVDDGVDLTGDGSTTHFMNDTDTTAGGFKGSKMWQSTIPNRILPDITTAFGNHLLNHREYISNAVTNGVPTGGEWVDTTYNIFNEAMYYGTVINGANHAGAGIYNTGCSKNQIKLFMLNQSSMNRRANIWLRDVVSASFFTGVGNNGGASKLGASYSLVNVLGYYLIH